MALTGTLLMGDWQAIGHDPCSAGGDVPFINDNISPAQVLGSGNMTGNCCNLWLLHVLYLCSITLQCKTSVLTCPV